MHARARVAERRVPDRSTVCENKHKLAYVSNVEVGSSISFFLCFFFLSTDTVTLIIRQIRLETNRTGNKVSNSGATLRRESYITDTQEQSRTLRQGNVTDFKYGFSSRVSNKGKLKLTIEKK